MRWVTRNDSLISAYWTEKGDTILHILTELSGIPWQEKEFDLYLLKYYPGLGSSDPLIVPLGGMKNEQLTEAAPTEYYLLFNLLYQLSGRMLAQTNQPEDGVLMPMAYHPLMRSGPLTRDNLAMILALTASYTLVGYDTTTMIYESAFWKEKTPGRHILEKYILNDWVITPDKPLRTWVLDEPYGSQLVVATRPPRKPKPKDNVNVKFFEDLPLKGQLGFTVKIARSGFGQVDMIDPYRLAYACGLREGDEIRRVDGYLVRNHREIVTRILESLDKYSLATLEVTREDGVAAVVIQPMLLPFMGDELDFEDELGIDSLDTAENFFPDDSL